MAEGVFNLTTQTQSTAFNLSSSKTTETKPASTPQPAAGPTPGTFNLTRQSDLNINMSAHKADCDCTGKRTTSLGNNQQSSPSSTTQTRSAFNLQTNTRVQTPEKGQPQINMSAHTANCDCTGKRTTSLGNNQPRSTFNLKTVSNPTEQPGQSQKTSSEPAIRMSAHKTDCDCTGKRTTSLGNASENKSQISKSIPQESRQRINEQRAASITGFDASSKKETLQNHSNAIPARVSQNPENIKPVITLGSTTMANPSLPVNTKNLTLSVSEKTSAVMNTTISTAKSTASSGLNTPRLTTPLGTQTPVAIAHELSAVAPQSASQAQVVLKNASPITIISNHDTSGKLIQIASKPASESISSFSQLAPNNVKNSAVSQTALPGLVAKFLTNEKITTLSLMQTLESKPAQATFKNGIPMSTLEEALQLKNPELIEKMLQIKANTYGFINMEAVKTAIQNNFVRHDALKKIFELLSGQIFSTVPEIELEGALKAYAEFLKEQKKNKLLDEEKERQRRRQKQKKQTKKEPLEGDEIKELLLVS